MRASPAPMPRSASTNSAVAQPPRLGIDHAGEEGPVGQRQREHRGFERRRHQLRQRERQDQLRQGEKHVGDAHDRLGQPAAAIAGDEPERHADPVGDHDDDDRDFERAARAENDAGEDVAPEIVGAERKGGAGRLQALQQMGGGGILRDAARSTGRSSARTTTASTISSPATAGRSRANFFRTSIVTAAPTAAGRASHAPDRSGC